MKEHWAVTVWRNGESVLTIESNSLAGRDLSPEDERAIEQAARSCLGFLGREAAALLAGEGLTPEKKKRSECSTCGHAECNHLAVTGCRYCICSEFTLSAPAPEQEPTP